ncbi:hypothetical protein NLJ89_g817 [Agrocybe chaxingu]|uniref:alpha-1,2-Mannosidase n=1 Tax=Agrocybe chaxingu TaxID=84603 RepID=A0A9W8TEB8_9AGAR|nr:hypothetical protein NLJ89_g817 [Agrocybe chaxingu]
MSRTLRHLLPATLSRLTLRMLLYAIVFLLGLYTLGYTMAPFSASTSRRGSVPETEPEPPLVSKWQARADMVKAAFLHAYHGYEKYAAQSDELRPVTNRSINNFNGWGVTVFDSLDTMLLMGLKDEYERGLEIVKNANFSKSADHKRVPYFETVIRYLGGLLSAYALSNDTLLIHRAEDLVSRLDPLTSQTANGPDVGILAELGTLQLEYTYLAKVTGKTEYYNRAAKINNNFAQADLRQTGGMLPVSWNLRTGMPGDTHLSVGARADSGHEYLLKLYLLTGKTDKASLEMYIRATTHIITNLLYLSPTRHLLYVSDTFGSTFTETPSPTLIFEHLSCFLPGLLALGAHTLPLDDLKSLGIDLEELGNEKLYGHAGKGYKELSGYNLKELHMWAAEGLAQTCWLTYADQPTGLGPDEIFIKFAYPEDGWINQGSAYSWIDSLEKWKESGSRGIAPGLAQKTPVVYTEEERLNGTGTGRDYSLRRPGYLLRPETVESLYLLWRITGDPKWRDRGWGIFEAIEKVTKTSSGYASLYSVETGEKEDSMPSYFMAETLKYLYLMFLDKDPVSLDRAFVMASLKQGEFIGSLDCGTTSVRFIVFDKHADIVAQHQLEFPQYYPNPGWHEHDADEIQQHADKCVEEAVKALEESGWAKESVKVIGITNQRETTVAWSRKTGKPLCKAIVWADSRTKNTVAHYEHKLQVTGIEVSPGVWKKGQDGIDALRDLTGLPLSTYFSAIKLRWMIDHHPEVRTAHEADDLLFGTVESWVAYNLLGGVETGVHIGEVTNASRTLLLNMTTLKWDPRLLEFFGLRESILPKLVSTSEVYGKVAYGALKGVPIGGLVGDQQAALIGNKCLKQGEAKCTYGTGAFLLFCTGDEIVKSGHGLLSTVAYQAGPGAKPVYALEGSIAVAGSAIKWLRDSMNLIESAADVNTLAAKESDTGGVYFVTAFSGLLAPYWDPGAAGLLIGISQYTNPSHIARATLEANAFQTHAIIQSMKLDSGTDLKHLKVDGGMTNGDLAMSILADIGGFSVVRPEMRESTALGSAICAGAAVNLFGWDLNKPESLSEVNTKGNRIFESNLPEAERKKRQDGWKDAVERSKGWDEGVDRED